MFLVEVSQFESLRPLPKRIWYKIDQLCSDENSHGLGILQIHVKNVSFPAI